MPLGEKIIEDFKDIGKLLGVFDKNKRPGSNSLATNLYALKILSNGMVGEKTILPDGRTVKLYIIRITCYV